MKVGHKKLLLFRARRVIIDLGKGLCRRFLRPRAPTRLMPNPIIPGASIIVKILIRKDFIMKKHVKVISLCIALLLILALSVAAVFAADEEMTEAESLLATIAETAPTLSPDGSSIILPTVSNSAYKVSIYGTSNTSVISMDGEVFTPLVDTEVGIMYKVSSTTDETQFAVDEYKEAKIMIKGKYTVSSADNKEPPVLPKLREWKGTTGTVTVTQNSKIVVTHPDYLETVQLANQYIKEICGFEPEIVSAGEAASGDIVISYTDSAELGSEGYTIELSDKIVISAYNKVGALYGMTTIAQMLDVYEGFTLPCGYVRDYPQFAVRAVMLDVARHYVPMEYLEEMTKYMAYFKVNVMRVHINDNGGQQTHAFRVESKKFPEINSNLNGNYYTQDEYRNYQREMLSYGIKVITEIDSPGHAGFVNLYDSSLTAPSPNTGVLNLSTDIHSTVDGVDYTYYDKSVEFMKALYDEFIGGDNPVVIPEIDTFHIGMDEYPLSHDMHKLYMTEMTEYVKSCGKTPQVWSSLYAEDFENPPIDTDVIVNYWGFADFEAHIERGYPCVANRPMQLYVVPGGTNSFGDHISLESLYNVYNVCDIGTKQSLAESSPILLGAEASFWNDKNTAASMQDVFERFHDQMLLISEKAWYGKNAADATVEEFMSRVYKFENSVPLVNPARYVPGNEDGDVAEFDFETVDGNTVTDKIGNYDAEINGLKVEKYNGNNMLTLDGEGYLSLPFDSLGYPYTVSFDLAYTGSENGVLFGGKSGELMVNFNGSGKLAFKREFQTYTFSHVFEEDLQYSIMIVCDMTETYLYVNGIFDSKATLYDIGTSNKNANNVKFSTLVLPTEKIGGGVIGRLDNLKMQNVAQDHNTLIGLDLVNYGNLALNQTVTGSGTEVNYKWGLECGVDGIVGTDDCTNKTSLNNKDDAWYQIDLGKVCTIEKIVVDFCEIPAEYEIFTSVDGEEWESVKHEIPASPRSKCIVTVELGGKDVRYVKYQTLKMFEVTLSSGAIGKYSGAFHEIMVYGYDIDDTVINSAKELLATLSGANKAYLESAISLAEHILENNEYTDVGVALKCLSNACAKISEGNAVASDADRTFIINLLKSKKDGSIYPEANYAVYDEAYRFALGAAFDLAASDKSLKLYSDRLQNAQLELVPPATYESNIAFDDITKIYNNNTTDYASVDSLAVNDYILIKYSDPIILKSFKLVMSSNAISASTAYVSYDGQTFVPITNIDVGNQQLKNVAFGKTANMSELYFPTALTNVRAIKIIVNTALTKQFRLNEVLINHMTDADVEALCPGINDLKAEDYAANSFKYFLTYQKSMAVTKQYLNNYNTYLKYLVACPDVDAINEEITRLKAISADDYTAVSYANLMKEIESAEKFISSLTLKQDVYDGQKVIDALLLAEENLVKVIDGVDTDALEEAIAADVDFFLYTHYSYKAYTEAVALAREYLASSDYTQDGVDEHLKVVSRRYANLETRTKTENAARNEKVVVTVSGQEVSNKFLKENVNDGVETRDSATLNKVSLNSSNDAWLTIDLGYITYIDRVDILWGNRAAKFKLQVSNDNTTWTDVYVDLNANQLNNNTDDFIYFEGGVEARYVRFQNILCFLGNPMMLYSYCGNFFEIRVYESDMTVYTAELEAVLDEANAVSDKLYPECKTEVDGSIAEAERVLALAEPTQAEIDAAAAAFKSHTLLAWINLGNKHSFECECGNSATENHNWDEGVVAGKHTTTYTCTDCSASYTINDYVQLTAARLNLNENINMVYLFSIDNAVTDIRFSFDFMGKTYTVSNYDITAEGKYIVKFNKIMPQYMNETVTASVSYTLDGEEMTVNCGGISVKEYLKTVIELYPSDTKLITLASDLLVYGAASQSYVDYDTENLATNGVDIKPTEQFTAPTSILNMTSNNSDLQFVGVGVNLANEVNFYITVKTAYTEGVTVKISINGRETAYDISTLKADKDGKYRINFNGVMAHEFDDAIVASFYLNGEEVGNTLTYSINSYVADTNTAVDTTLAKIVKAAYNYGASAKAYKEGQN